MKSYPERLVLAGVPRVHFYEGGPRCPEDIALPSVMRAVLEYLGEKDYGCRHCLAKNPDCTITCTYAYLVGVSGAASYFSWKEGWEGDNPAIFYMSADAAAPEAHIFRAIGYGHEWVTKEDGGDQALFRQKVVESINRGLPVLAYGVIGPPEPCIVTGYDDGGDTLVGWNFFQNVPEFRAGVSLEASGEFRKREWYGDTEALLLIGDRTEKPSMAQTAREALAWMLDVTRTPMVRPEADAPEHYRARHNGVAAYDAWIGHLIPDENWPAEDEAVLRAHHQIHNDAVGTVAEARWYGSVFLANLVEHFAAGPRTPGRASDLLHAAACYAAEHDLMWEIWELSGGIDNPSAYRTMADPEVRRAMAEIVAQARDQDAQAAEHIAHALGT